ncbi:hypothetical protein HMPREF3231_00188 [Bifidobacterium longum]|nr:hypothetical protein HMPREF3231_00188 [Bifidobacterium longum]BAP84502.1 hypothetical protein BL105A_1903 [Bifidobacterium longum]
MAWEWRSFGGMIQGTKRTPAVARRGEKGERRRKGVQLSGTAAAPDQLSADIFYITTAFWVYL